MTYKKFIELCKKYELEETDESDCYGFLGFWFVYWAGRPKVIPLKALVNYRIKDNQIEYFGPFQWAPRTVVKDNEEKFESHLKKLVEWYRKLPRSK